MKKYIKIEIDYNEEGNEVVNFSTQGLNEYEIIGILSLYRTRVETRIINITSKNKPEYER